MRDRSCRALISGYNRREYSVAVRVKVMHNECSERGACSSIRLWKYVSKPGPTQRTAKLEVKPQSPDKLAGFMEQGYPRSTE